MCVEVHLYVYQIIFLCTDDVIVESSVTKKREMACLCTDIVQNEEMMSGKQLKDHSVHTGENSNQNNSAPSGGQLSATGLDESERLSKAGESMGQLSPHVGHAESIEHTEDNELNAHVGGYSTVCTEQVIVLC